MTPIEFYNITENMLASLARSKGVTHLERYYELTDDSVFNNLSEKAKVFAQLAFHAQEATMLSSIVKFYDNYAFLENALCGFEPSAFLSKYPIQTKDNSVLQLVEDLRYNENTGKGLRWDSNKSKPENKDRLMKRYAKGLVESAAYVDTFETREAFLNDLLAHYPNNDFKKVIQYFRTRIPDSFSVALTCDFLKDFDKSFMDLTKPDIHIKDTMCAFYGHKDGYYNTEKREYECIEEMRLLTENINRSLPQDKQISVYQLDRMIWLICSGDFYLDKIDVNKSVYLQRVSGK